MAFFFRFFFWNSLSARLVYLMPAEKTLQGVQKSQLFFIFALALQKRREKVFSGRLASRFMKRDLERMFDPVFLGG
ncbi:MAG: hypothetical protein J5I94_14085 [Phaeodactylibacter sp.]|nr:hypothetical protein [Phaeodactylibacter sp.]